MSLKELLVFHVCLTEETELWKKDTKCYLFLVEGVDHVLGAPPCWNRTVLSLLNSNMF